MRYTILMFFVATLALSACKSSQQVMYETVPADFSMTITRTPCMGTCPYYDLTVMADGQVTFVGKGHTKLMGEHKKKLSAETMVAIKEVIKSSTFWDLEESYDNPNITDLPSVILSCKMDGKYHKVLSRIGAPKEFGYMVATLERLIGEGDYDPIVE